MIRLIRGHSIIVLNASFDKYSGQQQYGNQTIVSRLFEQTASYKQKIQGKSKTRYKHKFYIRELNAQNAGKKKQRDPSIDFYGQNNNKRERRKDESSMSLEKSKGSISSMTKGGKGAQYKQKSGVDSISFELPPKNSHKPFRQQYSTNFKSNPASQPIDVMLDMKVKSPFNNNLVVSSVTTARLQRQGYEQEQSLKKVQKQQMISGVKQGKVVSATQAKNSSRQGFIEMVQNPSSFLSLKKTIEPQDDTYITNSPVEENEGHQQKYLNPSQKVFNCYKSYKKLSNEEDTYLQTDQQQNPPLHHPLTSKTSFDLAYLQLGMGNRSEIIGDQRVNNQTVTLSLHNGKNGHHPTVSQLPPYHDDDFGMMPLNNSGDEQIAQKPTLLGFNDTSPFQISTGKGMAVQPLKQATISLHQTLKVSSFLPENAHQMGSQTEEKAIRGQQNYGLSDNKFIRGYHIFDYSLAHFTMKTTEPPLTLNHPLIKMAKQARQKWALPQSKREHVRSQNNIKQRQNI